jgi:multicomponent Na+:H+ antiporter subunit D
MNEWLVAGVLLAPLLGALGILLLRHSPNLRETATLASAFALFAIVVSITLQFMAADRAAGLPDLGSLTLAEPLPGIALRLAVEPLGLLFALIASGLWIVTSVYSIGYLRAKKEQNQTRYFLCFALSLASAMGVAFADNLFTLFVFYEALTLVTYPLVAHYGTETAREGARKYLQILLATSIGLFLPAIITVHVLAGSGDFVPGGILQGKLESTGVAPLLLLFLYGVGKAAVMPVHRWLPIAMVAPAPVSALLHAVAVVKAGVFVIAKLVIFIFGWQTLAAAPWADIPVYLAGFTIIAASLIALRQDNIKSMLAYSTVGQLSYVVMAAMLFLPQGSLAAAMHIAAHAVAKITLFFAAGSIYVASGKILISQLDGIGRRMPWTLLAITIAAASMIGLPPTAGFVSKWLLLEAAMIKESVFVVSVIIVSTALNAAYFLPILHRAFFKAPPADEPAHGEAPLPIVAALLLTATLTLLFMGLATPIASLQSSLLAEASLP